MVFYRRFGARYLFLFQEHGPFGRTADALVFFHIDRGERHVCFVPLSDKCITAKSIIMRSLAARVRSACRRFLIFTPSDEDCDDHRAD